ncbi:MAG TPA: methyltransferase domain-containing protein [Myxococcota bacterium]|nr:methyltransferase domain-containing protein [Myxococcota bacterium]
MSAFASGEKRWIERLGGLRNAIRQELIARQLASVAKPGDRVLDVGCGQGTQALRLAADGCQVTGVEPSRELRRLCERDALGRGVQIEVIDGTLEDLDALFRDRAFDLVLAHGVLMYLPNTGAALATLTRRVASHGRLAISFRNAHALAFRPGMRRDWAGALRAFDSDDYVNELGVTAKAHRLDDVKEMLGALGFTIDRWFGVRVFNDSVPGDSTIPADEDFATLLDAEEQAGRRDPYRWMASQLHVIASRP